MEGTVNLTLANLTLTHADGNGISINGFNRNLTIADSELSWIGDSAIAAWGYTAQGKGKGNVTLPAGVGIDGGDAATGPQPRGTRITGNVCHEVGLWQKQSSCYFQAQACETTLSNNVFYNGPRALINFDDQFGGGNRLSRNLLLNSCRETADHG